jgi:hypothetical protein
MILGQCVKAVFQMKASLTKFMRILLLILQQQVRSPLGQLGTSLGFAQKTSHFYPQKPVCPGHERSL